MKPVFLNARKAREHDIPTRLGLRFFQARSVSADEGCLIKVGVGIQFLH